MFDLDFRKLLGHGRVWVLVLTLVVAVTVAPARAEASSHRGGARPHAARVLPRRHASARLRPHARLRPRLRRHASALVPDAPPRVSGGRGRAVRVRPDHAITATPAAARRSHAVGTRGEQHRASPAARHRLAPGARHRPAQAARHRASHAHRSSRARPIGLHRHPGALIVARYEPSLTFSPAAGPGGAPRSAAHAHSRHRGGADVSTGRRRIIGPRLERKRAVIASAVAVMATISPPASSSLPPGGAEGFATGAGGASAGATASAVLALASVALLAALLPGLLALDVLPWRSAVLILRLERPD